MIRRMEMIFFYFINPSDCHTLLSPGLHTFYHRIEVASGFTELFLLLETEIPLLLLS